jgi:DMSO/TMAO reductase YedYZ molybdopterin-dependent catalytic subunit
VKLNKKWLGRKLLALMLVLTMILGQVPLLQNEGVLQAQGQPDLVITGTGLVEDVVITDWADYTVSHAMEDRFYSSNNNFNFHKIWKVRGYDLFNLIGSENLITDDLLTDYSITFVAKDGARVTKTVSELQSQYYYPDFTVASEQRVSPMLAFYRAALFEPSAGLPTNVTWEDRELTEADKDNNAPRLHMGQVHGNVSDINQQFFLRDLVRIVVGDERPDILTVRGDGVAAEKTFNLAQLKAVPAEFQINEDYVYNTKTGAKTASIKGVSLWYVLDTMVGITDPQAQVNFICSDGYLVDPKTQSEIADPALKYVLATRLTVSRSLMTAAMPACASTASRLRRGIRHRLSGH